jgi:hypothetical protein
VAEADEFPSSRPAKVSDGCRGEIVPLIVERSLWTPASCPGDGRRKTVTDAEEIVALIVERSLRRPASCRGGGRRKTVTDAD